MDLLKKYFPELADRCTKPVKINRVPYGKYTIVNVVCHIDRVLIERGIPRGWTLVFESGSLVGNSYFYPKFANDDRAEKINIPENITELSATIKYSGMLGKIAFVWVNDRVVDHIITSKNSFDCEAAQKIRTYFESFDWPAIYEVAQKHLVWGIGAEVMLKSDETHGYAYNQDGHVVTCVCFNGINYATPDHLEAISNELGWDYSQSFPIDRKGFEKLNANRDRLDLPAIESFFNTTLTTHRKIVKGNTVEGLVVRCVTDTGITHFKYKFFRYQLVTQCLRTLVVGNSLEGTPVKPTKSIIRSTVEKCIDSWVLTEKKWARGMAYESIARMDYSCKSPWIHAVVDDAKEADVMDFIADRPLIIAPIGLPGLGKSTVLGSIAKAFDIPYFSQDLIKAPGHKMGKLFFKMITDCDAPIVIADRNNALPKNRSDINSLGRNVWWVDFTGGEKDLKDIVLDRVEQRGTNHPTCIGRKTAEKVYDLFIGGLTRYHFDFQVSPRDDLTTNANKIVAELGRLGILEPKPITVEYPDYQRFMVQLVVPKIDTYKDYKPPKHHHVTLGYNLASSDLNKWTPDQEFTVTVDGFGQDLQNAAYRVALPKDLVYVNGLTPHITLGTKNKGQPFNSNMLDFEPIEPFDITGRVVIKAL